jgi:hypothetical protein
VFTGRFFQAKGAAQETQAARLSMPQGSGNHNALYE